MDVKLSKRMQTVADMVEETKVVDIGCDHAFVSIYLARKPEVENVIAMDVRKGPVDIARGNVVLYGLNNYIDVRMSDGFEKLAVGEANVAVIAGMGGYLIIDILTRGKIHLDRGINLVLQPQSDIRALREYLVSVNYKIIKEEMILEDGKYYTIIKAHPNQETTMEYNEDELTYGPCLLSDRHEILHQYLKNIYVKNNDLAKKLQDVGSDKSKDRMNQISKENQQIHKILEYYYEESI